MKIGVSSYSLLNALKSGEMTILEAIDWIARIGGEHVEIVPLGFNLTDDSELIETIVRRASDAGLDISNYAVGADFIQKTQEEYEKEIQRVMKEVEIASRLGVKRMRHDLAWCRDVSIGSFLKELPRMVEACQRIADYAKSFDITTSIENHGYFVQASDRVQSLIIKVDRPNFKTTMDIGNFMCADEDPVAAVRKNVTFASMIHVKDFYLRKAFRLPGANWFKTTAGNYLRGAIIGHGDIDMAEVLSVIKQAGYDGYLSVEFEGMEECKLGTKLGLENIKKLWDEV